MSGPKVELSGGAVLVLAGLLVGGFALFRASQAAGSIGTSLANGAAAVGQAINPFSDQNLAYRGVNAVGEAITGDANWTLGGATYDAWGPPARAEGGLAFLDQYRVNPPAVQAATGTTYQDPLVNNDGADFRYF